jgi:hypothetical protein
MMATPTTLVPLATSLLDQAQSNTFAAVQKQVVDWNTVLKTNYQTAFDNWLQSYANGRISDRSTAPQPPMGYVLAYFTDPTTGPGSVGPYGDIPIQWAYPRLGTTANPTPLVCDMPPIPAPAAAAPVVGTPVYQVGDVMNCPVGDPWPVGHIETDPDTGAEYQKMSHPSPFSQTRVVYFYERIK